MSILGFNNSSITPPSLASGPTDENITTVWGSATGKSNSFFEPIDIQGKRWNQLYPYRLLVAQYDQTTGNYTTVNDGVGVGKNTANISVVGGRISFWENAKNEWSFTLPITPEQLSIGTNFASLLTATQGGIVEENNGVKFKNITFSGTMGVWPQRAQISTGLPDSNIWSGAVQSAIGSTLNALDNIVSKAKEIASVALDGYPLSRPKNVDPSANNVTMPWSVSGAVSSLFGDNQKQGNIGGYYGTGYVNALLLDQFLEQYAEAKKNPINASWRLVFDIPKQNQSFLVTPIQFNWNQSADAPNEVRYSLQLKAWKRIKLGTSPKYVQANSLPHLTLNALKRAAAAIALSLQLVGDIYALMTAITSDAELPLRAMKAVSQLLKALSGIVPTFNDMGKNIAQAYKQQIIQALANVDPTTFTSAKSRAALIAIQTSATQNEGQGSQYPTQKTVSNTQSNSAYQGSLARHNAATDPVNLVFNNPIEYYEIFDAVPINALQLTPQQIQRLNSYLIDPKTITVNQLRVYRGQILDLAILLANFYGMGSDQYNEFYGLNLPNYTENEVTINNYLVLNSLYDVIQSIDNITATQDLDDGRILNAMQYVGGLANANGITFDQSQSKIVVPVPYGLNMEQIAVRYLNDPNRWLEIATLNGLVSPYIDEDGFVFPLLSNGTGRQFTVSDASSLIIGQTIFISSNTQPLISLQIINIQTLGPSSYLISVAGNTDLSPYTVADGASIKAYQPNTVNSTNQIYIPSNDTPSNESNTLPIPALSNEALVGLSKVDFLLAENNDVAFDSYKDVKLSAGITNLTQAVKLILLTPTGSLLTNPSAGAGLVYGTSVADLNAGSLYDKIKSAILADPRFTSIKSLQIELKPPSLIINLAVTYSENLVLPISFSVPA